MPGFNTVDRVGSVSRRNITAVKGKQEILSENVSKRDAQMLSPSSGGKTGSG